MTKKVSSPFWEATVSTLKWAPTLVRGEKWALLLAFIVNEALLQLLFSLSPTETLAYPGGQLAQTLMIASVGLGLSLFLFLLIPLRIEESITGAPRRSLWTQTKLYTLPLTTEGLRVAAIVLLWTLALILPGLQKFLRYTFVPYIVMFDDRYARQEIDALQEAARLTRGLMVGLWVFLILSAAAMLLLEEMHQNKFTQGEWSISVGFGALSFMLNFAINTWVYGLYRARKSLPAAGGM